MAKPKKFGLSDSMKQSYTESLSASREYAGKLCLELLPINQIKLHPKNPRKLSISINDCFNSSIEPLKIGLDKNDTHYEKKEQEIMALVPFAKSIRRGLINPILVYKSGDSYYLEAGERRVLATALLSKNEILARIADKEPQDLELGLIQWDENNQRADFSLLERLDNLRQIIRSHCKVNMVEESEIKPSIITELLNVSRQTATCYYNVLYSDDQLLREYIEHGTINSLKKANLICLIQNLAERKEAMLKLKNGISIDKLKKMKPKIKGRGQRLQQVRLGSAKNTKAVKFLIEKMMELIPLSEKQKGELKGVNWKDFKATTSAFKLVFNLFEEKI